MRNIWMPNKAAATVDIFEEWANTEISQGSQGSSYGGTSFFSSTVAPGECTLVKMLVWEQNGISESKHTHWLTFSSYFCNQTSPKVLPTLCDVHAGIYDIHRYFHSHHKLVTGTEWWPYLSLWQCGLPGSEIVATDTKIRVQESDKALRTITTAPQFPFTSGTWVEVILSNTIFLTKWKWAVLWQSGSRHQVNSKKRAPLATGSCFFTVSIINRN